ncbi:MAG: hypothetical protein VKJ02_01230 [Snowella sp.]|nr:hypothetical protein [Snowella sp.]
MASLRIANLVKQQSVINQMIWQQAKTNHLIFNRLQSVLKLNVTEVQGICRKNHLSPADLPKPSRAVYAWMQFLMDDDNLHRHCQTIQRALTIAEAIAPSRSQPLPPLFIELLNFSAIYKAKITAQSATIQLSEAFIQADDDMLRTVMRGILIKKTPDIQTQIRHFATTEAYKDVLLSLDLIAQIDSERAQGNYYDLEELFIAVRDRYLEPSFVKPRLCWNSLLTKRKLGHYESSRDRVVLSPTLDSANVPRFVVEFVLYHELLHKQHGIQWVNGKQRVHTPAFRQSERQFQFYEQAIAFLKQMGTEESF